MLGRYIAGTLLILGAAMMVAPDSPEKPDNVVARTETSPSALVTAKPAELASALEKSSVPEMTTTVASSKNIEAGVEAALAQALALDAAEEAAEASLEPVAKEQVDEPITVTLAVATPDTPASATPDTPASEPEPAFAEPEPRMLFVTGTRVNVREGPSTQYRVVGTVAYGDPVELVAFEGQSWARIRIGDGETTGFMSRKFLANELAGG